MRTSSRRAAGTTTHPTSPAVRARAAAVAVPALVAVLALSGCASTSDAASGSVTAGGTAAGESATRVVETAFGPVTIPTHPEKVVALEGGTGPSLEAGVTPVATTDGDWPDSFLADEYPLVEDQPLILGPDGYDLEAIAALEPDLLVGFVRGGKEEELSAEKKTEWETLSQIAPTVLIRSTGSASVKDAAVEIQTALGDGEQAEAEKAAYEAQAAEIKEKYADVLAANTFAALDSYEEVTVYSPISWLGGILTDIGAPLTEIVKDESTENGAFLSYEQLAQIDDATVVLHEELVDGTAGPGAEELAAASTYQELPAVAAGHDYGVRYFFADRYVLASDVLDQLEEILQDLDA